MSQHDDLIQAALSAEDRELLARHTEPGYFRQAFGLFRGPLGWVLKLAYGFGLVAFAGFLWALWQAFAATDVVAVVQWGVIAVVLFQASAMIKNFMSQHLETNRLLREIKRVELQVALLRSGQSGSAV